VPSATFAAAASTWRALRMEYEDYLEATYARAAEDCRGALLNERGRRAGVESRSLFMGNARRAHAYASPELIEWWQTNPRVPFSDYEAMRTEYHDEEEPTS
jgi:hypothetical protein